MSAFGPSSFGRVSYNGCVLALSSDSVAFQSTRGDSSARDFVAPRSKVQHEFVVGHVFEKGLELLDVDVLDHEGGRGVRNPSPVSKLGADRFQGIKKATDRKVGPPALSFLILEVRPQDYPNAKEFERVPLNQSRKSE